LHVASTTEATEGHRDNPSILARCTRCARWW